MIIIGCSSAFHLSVENQKITILSWDVHQLYTGVSTAVEPTVDREPSKFRGRSPGTVAIRNTVRLGLLVLVDHSGAKLGGGVVTTVE